MIAICVSNRASLGYARRIDHLQDEKRDVSLVAPGTVDPVFPRAICWKQWQKSWRRER